MNRLQTMLTQEQFDARWTHINEQREAKQESVDGWFDQHAAALFEKSGWTQQRIADKVGMSRQRVTQLLLFGRFLGFATSGSKLQKPGFEVDITSNLTERRFREYWEATEKQPKEEHRFCEVAKMIGAKVRTRKDKVLATCADGKFHTLDRIAEIAEITEDEARATIQYLNRKPSDVRVETNGSKTNPKYKLKRGSGKKIDLTHVWEEIEPFLQDLERQGKCESAAEYAPKVILIAVHQLRKKLEELSV